MCYICLRCVGVSIAKGVGFQDTLRAFYWHRDEVHDIFAFLSEVFKVAQSSFISMLELDNTCSSRLLNLSPGEVSVKVSFMFQSRGPLRLGGTGHAKHPQVYPFSSTSSNLASYTP